MKTTSSKPKSVWGASCCVMVPPSAIREAPTAILETKPDVDSNPKKSTVDAEIVLLLLTNGANIEATNKVRVNTPLLLLLSISSAN